MIYNELGTHNQKSQRSTYLQIRTQPTKNTHWFSWNFTKQSGDFLPNKGVLDFKPYTQSNQTLGGCGLATIFEKLHPLPQVQPSSLYQFHISFLLTKETVVKLLGWFWETAKFFKTHQSKVFGLDSKHRVSGFSYQGGLQVISPLRTIETHYTWNFLLEINRFWRLKPAEIFIGCFTHWRCEKWGKETNWLNF